MENRQRFVRGGGRRCFGTYSTVTQICRTCAVKKTRGGPRAQVGTCTMGTITALIHGYIKAVY